MKREWLFVVARIYLGLTFFFSDHGAAQPGELAGFLSYATTHGYGWYQGFLSSVVLPHASTFGTLVVVAELYVAVALVFGVTTRVAAGVAIFLCLNYLCAKGDPPWGPGVDQSDIVLGVIVLLGDAGRTFGIDRVLHRKLPRVPLW